MSKNTRVILSGSHCSSPCNKRVCTTPHNKTLKFHLRLNDGQDQLPSVAASVQAGLLTPLNLSEITNTVLSVSAAVLEKVRAALTKAGFIVGDYDPFTRLLAVEGKAKLVRKHLGAVLNEYRAANGHVYTGRHGRLGVPRSWGISSYVCGIHGIDQRPKATPRLVRFNAGRSTTLAAKSWNALEAAKHYKVPLNKLGDGFACGFVSLGGGIDPAVVTRANARLGLPAPQITIITVGGATNSPSGSLDGPDGENYLDVQMQAAVAPKAKIIMGIGPNTTAGFAQALLAIAKHELKPTKISISWGASEDTSWTADDRALMDQALQTCAAMGIIVYCAAGDDGSSDGASATSNSGGNGSSGQKSPDDGNNSGAPVPPKRGKQHCDYPSSSPWNVACSGVYDDGSTVKAWNSGFGGGATGGGVSAVYTNYTVGQLLLQKAGIKLPVNADSKKPGRIVGDISGIAAPETGIEVMAPDGSVMVIGGTSAVAPFHAGAGVCIDSELGHAMPDLNTVLYKAAAAGKGICVAVTKGNNGAYSCKAGDVINAVCGLGPIDYSKLLSALR
jgi:kumamolisin